MGKQNALVAGGNTGPGKERLHATTMFGREDTIVAYASLKAAVPMLTIQYANAFRMSGIPAHIKINAATRWVHEGVDTGTLWQHGHSPSDDSGR